MITTQEIVQRTNLSSRTLNRWQREGILPGPVKGTHPSGRGRTCYWPPDTIERVREVQRLRAQGYAPRHAQVLLRATRGEAAEDAVPVYKGQHADVLDLLGWVLDRYSGLERRFDVGVAWEGQSCVAYCSTWLALRLTEDLWWDRIKQIRTERKKGGEP